MRTAGSDLHHCTTGAGCIGTVDIGIVYRRCIKKWTISYHCLDRLYHTDAENFYNVFIFRVPKTLVRMFTLRCSNRNSQIARSVRSLDVNMSVTS